MVHRRPADIGQQDAPGGAGEDGGAVAWVASTPKEHRSPCRRRRADARAGSDGVDTEEFWRRHLEAGLLLYAGTTVLAAVYLWLTPDGPHRVALWVMVGFSFLSTASVALPRRRIVVALHRSRFFFAWSATTCVFAASVTVLDNGLGSPLAVVLFLPMAYASLTYPPPAVAGVGATAAISATGAAIVAGDTFARAVLFVGIIGMFTSLAASVARARDQQRCTQRALTARLEDLATHDGLTGCLNHRRFYERLAAELSRAVRYGHGVALLMIDIDDFKSINDNFGHLAGDQVLRSIGELISHAVRTTDAAGRVGGDEFAVLLAETSREAARQTAVRLQRAVAELPGPVPTAVTVGVAYVAGTEADVSPQALVAIADARLYQRKHQTNPGPRHGVLFPFDP